MNEQERAIATKVWPEKMRDDQIGLRFFNADQHEFAYQSKVEAAKVWLGDRYLLAHPIIKRRVRHS